MRIEGDIWRKYEEQNDDDKAYECILKERMAKRRDRRRRTGRKRRGSRKSIKDKEAVKANEKMGEWRKRKRKNIKKKCIVAER